MARAFKPSTPYNVPLELLIPEYRESDYGGKEQVYPESGVLFFGTFKTFGGTDREVNGLYSVENTANIETWYRPDIKSDCRIKVVSTGAIFDILGEPENINMQNQHLKFKVIAVKGVA